MSWESVDLLKTRENMQIAWQKVATGQKGTPCIRAVQLRPRGGCASEP